MIPPYNLKPKQIKMEQDAFEQVLYQKLGKQNGNFNINL